MTFPNLKTLLGHSSRTTAFVGVDTSGVVVIVNEDGSAFTPGTGISGRLVNQLRDEEGSEGEVRFLKGFSVAGDGGQGDFRWSDDSASDDGGTRLNNGGFGSVGPGWRRNYDGHVNAAWFGATGDCIINSNGVNIGLGGTTFAYGLSDAELATMVGDVLVIEGAGANKAPHITTIVSAVSGVVTFADPTLSAVTGATFTHGTDNRPFIQRAIDAIAAASGSSTPTELDSATLLIPPGRYLLGGPLIAGKFSGGQFFFSWLRIQGDGNTLQGEGNPNATTLVVADPEQAAIIVQTASVEIEHLAIIGRNTWSGIDGLFTTSAEAYYPDEWANAISTNLAEAAWVKKGCRENRYSPHAAIVVDPFHSTVAGGDQYPGLSAYYVNAGGSTHCKISKCYIESFVCGIAIGINPVTLNCETNAITDTNILECATALAFGCTQSRNSSFEGGQLQAGDWMVDCQKYGQQNGAPPQVTRTQGGGGGIIRTANSGQRGEFKTCYFGESLTRISMCPSDSVYFDDCPFGFFSTPAGKPAYVKTVGVSNFNSLASFEKCLFFAITPDAETFWFHNAIFDSCDFPTDADHTHRFWLIGSNNTGTNIRNSASEVGAGNFALESGGGTRLLSAEAQMLSTPAPRGGAFLTTTTDDEPDLRWIDSSMQLAVVGAYDVTVNADGTTTIDGANLDQVFAIGQIVDGGGLAVSDVIDGAGETVPALFGKVTTVTPTEVTLGYTPTFVVDEFSAAGAVSRVLFKYSRHDVHVPTTGSATSASASVTSVSAPTYWQQYMPVRDEDGYLGVGNYLASKSGTTFTLAKNSSATATVYMFDQPTWSILRGFKTQQVRLFDITTSVGQLNGAIVNDDIDFQVWTPRAARAATIAAGSTDKDSGNGAWVGIGGAGSTHADYASLPFVKFGGVSNLQFITADADGTNESTVASLSKTGTLRLNEDLRIDADSSNVVWTVSAGSPEGAVAANKGSLCSDTTNGRLYVKNSGSGNTGWQIVTQT